MIRKSEFYSHFRLASGFVAVILVFGTAAFAIEVVNTPSTGYVLCVDYKTKAVTFPGKSNCPRGTKQLILGAQGMQGLPGEKGDNGAVGPKGDVGPSGLAGTNGAPGTTGPVGARGASLLTGVGTPPNTLGENGDTYIDKNSAQIYGPKTSGIWGYPISFAGPGGAQGPAGAAGTPGLSNAYFSFGPETTTLNGSSASLCHTSGFQLPSGNYVVTANVNGRAPSSASQFNAYVKVGSQSSQRVTGTWVLGSSYGSQTVVWAFRNVAANSSVEVWCDSSATMEVKDISVVAIAINNLTAPVG